MADPNATSSPYPLSMDSVPQRVATVPPPPPESAEDSGKQLNLKSGSKNLREMYEGAVRKNSATLLDRYKDIEKSELRKKYDDSETPYFYLCDRFHYRNKAQLRLDEEIKKAMDGYTRQSALLPPGPYDAIAPPAIAGLCGSLRPLTITDDNRDRLIRSCDLALDKYNAENENQVSMVAIFLINHFFPLTLYLGALHLASSSAPPPPLLLLSFLYDFFSVIE